MLDLSGVIAADIEASKASPVEKEIEDVLGANLPQGEDPAPVEVEPVPVKADTPLVDEDGNPLNAKDVADFLYWKKHSRKNEDAAKAARSEKEQLAYELAELKEQIKSIQRSNIVGKVIATHSLPEAAEQFLTGSTEAELNASAAKLVETFGVKRKVGRPTGTPNPLQAQPDAPRKELTLGEIAGLA